MSIDPETHIKPIREWGPECSRGFVRDARFGPGQVIKGTNRAKSRKNKAVSNWDNVKPRAASSSSDR
jgi:hypothetical protein